MIAQGFWAAVSTWIPFGMQRWRDRKGIKCSVREKKNGEMSPFRASFCKMAQPAAGRSCPSAGDLFSASRVERAPSFRMKWVKRQRGWARTCLSGDFPAKRNSRMEVSDGGDGGMSQWMEDIKWSGSTKLFRLHFTDPSKIAKKIALSNYINGKKQSLIAISPGQSWKTRDPPQKLTCSLPFPGRYFLFCISFSFFCIFFAKKNAENGTFRFFFPSPQGFAQAKIQPSRLPHGGGGQESLHFGSTAFCVISKNAHNYRAIHWDFGGTKKIQLWHHWVDFAIYHIFHRNIKLQTQKKLLLVVRVAFNGEGTSHMVAPPPNSASSSGRHPLVATWGKARAREPTGPGQFGLGGAGVSTTQSGRKPRTQSNTKEDCLLPPSLMNNWAKFY